MGFDQAETIENLWILLPELSAAQSCKIPLDHVARICPNRCSADAMDIELRAHQVRRNGGHWPRGGRGNNPARIVQGVDIYEAALAERLAMLNG